MAVRRNPDGTLTVGIIPEKNISHKLPFEPDPEEAPVKEPVREKKAPAKKPSTRKTTKKA